MTDFKNSYNLRKYNTFNIEVKAKFFIDISVPEQLSEIIESEIFRSHRRYILGGGSNILFTRDYDGLMLHSQICGKEIVYEDKNDILIRVGSGEEWDSLVEYAVNNNWGGLENLSKIPGSVGAAPIQNIGAYGVEAKDLIESVEGINLLDGRKYIFSNSDCAFEYRNSIFKNKLKSDFFVTYVTFRLRKPPHELNYRYGRVEEELAVYSEKNIRAIREVVCKIREEKLPDVNALGNAGSFFKNPVVLPDIANKLKQEFEDLPMYPEKDNRIKLSAAWFIDKSGCKGIRKGNAATHNKQPLVLINLGGASGQEIIELSRHIQKEVDSKFGVKLQPEVNIL